MTALLPPAPAGEDGVAPEDLLRPGEAAALLGVRVEALKRWDAQGKLTVRRTESGQRRFLRSEVAAIAATRPRPPRPEDPLLTAEQVAVMFRVEPKTVARWAREGKLTAVRTPGGRRRYREAEVKGLLGMTPPAAGRGMRQGERDDGRH